MSGWRHWCFWRQWIVRVCFSMHRMRMRSWVCVSAAIRLFHWWMWGIACQWYTIRLQQDMKIISAINWLFGIKLPGPADLVIGRQPIRNHSSQASINTISIYKRRVCACVRVFAYKRFWIFSQNLIASKLGAELAFASAPDMTEPNFRISSFNFFRD